MELYSKENVYIDYMESFASKFINAIYYFMPFLSNLTNRIKFICGLF